jgi:hypothetical protein
MMGQTTTTKSRPRGRARHIVALTVCALAIPATANAQPIDSDPTDTGYSSVNSITGGSSGSSGPAAASPVTPDQVVAPASVLDSSTAPSVDSGYSSLNAITGPTADAPTFASSSPTGSDGFDWPSALVGAGAALALSVLGAAALLTVRRRSTVAPSPSTS